MDADYDPHAATLDERNFGLDGTSRRTKRRRNKLKKALDKKKPLFNPSNVYSFVHFIICVSFITLVYVNLICVGHNICMLTDIHVYMDNALIQTIYLC